MRLLILILLLFGYFDKLIAQAPSAEIKLSTPKGNLNCSYKPKYSAAKRMQFYPFNLPFIVQLVSFRYHHDNYPIKGNSVLIDSLTESRTLSKKELDTLTDILYNNFYKKDPNYGSLTQCFFPRNAILFLDDAGRLKEYILICFHCDRHKESSDNVDFGDDCTQKVEKLRQFFVSSGLKYGTDKNIEAYPGENIRD